MTEFFIYMFLDKKELPLYIGMSINLKKRIETEHFKSENGNLSKECIAETDRILYHKAVSIDDMKIKEKYLINTLAPKYNIKLNNESKFTFTIDIDWKLYSIDKVKLLEKQKSKRVKRVLNYNRTIIRTENSWLPYGVFFDKKICYLTIKPKEPIEMGNGMYGSDITYFLQVNNILYIKNTKLLAYYTANYKSFNFNPKVDVLSIIAPIDNKLFETDLHVYSEGEDALEGASFIKYKIVKEMKLLDEKLINHFEKRLNKFYLNLKTVS